MAYDDVADAALGLVPIDGRGSMPFAMLHHESLVAVASWALGEAGIELLDFTVGWADTVAAVVARDTALVVHDPLCPGTPVAFIREAVAAAGSGNGSVVVGVRPVTDTVRAVDASGALGATVDRAQLLAVASPVVIPAAVLASLDQQPDLDDLADLVAALRRDHEVTFLDAPPEARRVVDESDVRLLESLLPPGAVSG
jgi:2-C-methyl-D-erythritol 4-phosphate cytidylyltransferase